MKPLYKLSFSKAMHSGETEEFRESFWKNIPEQTINLNM